MAGRRGPALTERRRRLVDLEARAAGVDVAVPPLDARAMRLARQRQDRLTKPQGSLGELEALSVRLAGMAGRLDPRLGARTFFVPSGDDRAAAAPADREDALGLVESGRRLVREERGRGLDVAIVGGGSAVAATTLVCAILGLDPADLGLDPADLGLDPADLGRSADALDPVTALAVFGDAEIAELTGVVLEAAAHRCPVLLGDGPSVAAAMVATAIAPNVPGYLVAACAPADPGPAAGLRWLDLRPLLDLDVRLAGGAEALLALPLLDASVRILNEMATFEGAGVSDAL